MNKYEMRRKQIEDFLEKLKKLWLRYPEERFGQLLFNYTRFGTRAELGRIFDIFHYWDDDILGDINEELKKPNLRAGGENEKEK